MGSKRAILEEYPRKIRDWRHSRDAIQLLLDHLHDTSIVLQEKLGEPDHDRILRLIGEFEEVRDKYMLKVEDAATAYKFARLAISRLDPEHAWILTARYLEGMSLRRIARELGVSKTTVSRRLDKALECIEEISD